MIAAIDRSLERQHRKDIAVNQTGKLAQFRQGQRTQVSAAFIGKAYGLGHCFVRLTERHSFFCQVIGQIGCRGVAAHRCFPHRFPVDADASQ